MSSTPEAAADPRLASTCPECGEPVGACVRLCPNCGLEPPALELLAGTQAQSSAGSDARMFAIWPGATTVGRSTECGIVLRDRSISRVHARVVCERGRVRVEDMGGVNGVYVGNERVERAELAPGVVVQLGRVVLRYVQAASESATTERIHRGLVLQGTLPGADTPVRDAAVLALDQLNMGVMLLGAGGQPLVVNRSARAILDAKEGLEIGSSGLRCRDASASRRLSALLDDDAPRAGAVLVPRPGRRPLTLLVTSLGPAGGVAGGSWRAVFLSDPERGIESGEEMLARLYELTPAEARITGELLQGHTVEEAAAELGVTVHTARTHLRHVFSKTDTRRQSELVLLLLNGPGQLRS